MLSCLFLLPQSSIEHAANSHCQVTKMLAPCGYYKELAGINSLEWRTSWSSVQVYSHTLAVKVFHSLNSLTQLSARSQRAVNQSRSHAASPAARLECRRMTYIILFTCGSIYIALFRQAPPLSRSVRKRRTRQKALMEKL